LDGTLSNWSQPKRWEQISSPGSEASITFISDEEIVWTSTQNSDGFADLLTFQNPEKLIIPENFESPSAIVLNQTEAEEKVEIQEIVPIYPSSSVGFPEVKVQEKSVPVDEPNLSWLVIDESSKSRILDYSLFSKKGAEWGIENGPLKLNELKKSGVTELRFQAAKYFPVAIPVDRILSGEPNVILLRKAAPGSTFTLEKVAFKRGTAELEGVETLEFLNEIAEFLIENPDLTIRISGHTDNAGDPGLNKALSLERAAAVRDYLVEKGIEFEKLRIAGWGGTRPVTSNATEAGRAKNRRVELTVEN
jgi:outer membrane protein OmpA-like peptidoglycan-associated protein